VLLDLVCCREEGGQRRCRPAVALPHATSDRHLGPAAPRRTAGVETAARRKRSAFADPSAGTYCSNTCSSNTVFEHMFELPEQ